MADEELLIEAEETQPPPDETALLATADLDIEEHDEFEPVRLTWKQWLYISLTVVLSFLFFGILMFPLDDIVRWVARSNLPGLEIQDLELNYITKDNATDLQYANQGLSVQARTIRSGLAWWSLANQNLNGPIDIQSIQLHHPLFGLRARELKLQFQDVGPLQQNSPKPLQGSLKAQLAGLVVEDAGPLAVEKDLIKISKADVELVFDQGRTDVRQLQIQSNAFQISLKNGSIGPAASLATAPLRGQLCLTPTNEFKTSDAFLGLRTMYEFSGGSLEERFCTELQGSLGKPEIKTRPPLNKPDVDSTDKGPQAEPDSPATANPDVDEAD
ncbi:MAG: hypothetical protein KDK39_01860 [Leptospiraceae bacterium]|nr:hypothetical protein [Leptospiraceae bacterium]